MEQETLQYWNTWRSRLLNDFDHTVNISKDREARNGVLQSIRQFNREVPSRFKRISRKTLSDSQKARRRDRKLREARIAPQRGDRAISREISRLFPTLTDIEDTR